MQNIPRKALCLIATFLLSGSLHADQSVAFSSGYDPCAVVDAFQRLHDDADGSFPDHFGAYEAKRDGTEFDVNLYFTVLKHLSPPEGYVLDYVYFRCLGGMPVLYWRKQNAARFSTYGEYDKNAGGYDKIIEQENRLSSRLVLDGTPESYLELMVFDTLKGSFYLKWHMKFRQRKAVASKQAIGRLIRETGVSSYRSVDEMLKDLENFCERLLRKKDRRDVSYLFFQWDKKYVDGAHGWLFCEDQVQKALALDPTPLAAAANRETMTVAMVIFTPWFGFMRIEKTFEKQPPYGVTKTQNAILAEYYCGVTSF